MSDYEYVKSSELQAGDRVLAHGAKVLLEGKPTTYSGYQGMIVYHWPEQRIIEGSVMTFEHLKTWTIQGNDNARWYVER